MPRRPVNVCFSKAIWAVGPEVFLTFLDEATHRVFVVMPETLGYALWPWARWQREFGLDARFSVRASPEAQVAALSGVLGLLGDEYDDVRFWARVRRVLGAAPRERRARVVAQYLRYVGLPQVGDVHTATPESIRDLFLDGRAGVRML